MRRHVSVVLAVCLLLTGGCWDRREINELALVVAVAADVVREKGQEEVMLTLQIANPVALLPGQGGGGGGSAAKAFWTITGKGQSVRDASVAMLNKIPKKLFYGQARVYVIGEDAAKSGIARFLDRPLRYRSTRRNMYLAIARGSAKQVMEVEMPTFRATGIAISNIFDLEGGHEAILPVTLNDFVYWLSTGSTCPVAPAVLVMPQTSVSSEDLKVPGKTPKAIEVSGLAVFDNRQGRLLGFFNEKETAGLMWVLGKVKEREITVPCSGGTGKQAVVLTVVKSESRIVVDRDSAGSPVFFVKIRTLCNLAENFGSREEAMMPSDLQELEVCANSCIKQEIMSALHRARVWKADVFGFGEELRRQDPDQWRKLAASWGEMFPGIRVEVETKTTLRQRGLSIEAPGARKGER